MNPRVAVFCESSMPPEVTDRAQDLAHDLDLPLIVDLPFIVEDFEYLLAVTADRLELRSIGARKPGPVFVDFINGTLDYRRRHARGSEPIIKALGGSRQRILDGTAGLATDTFVIAGFDNEVTSIEQNSVIAALVIDGLRRGLADHRIENICERINFRLGDSLDVIEKSKPGAWDAIYLDPMFPEKKKAAASKKELRVLQDFAGKNDSGERESRELLKAARMRAQRVVVKRPMRAKPLAEDVTHSLKGASIRFDIYIRR